ncbi:hypothetical protein A7R75_20810 [Mycolicibacterium llatzerense]|nr:hypothetical protein [Mycolicibacterium llatzerense]
MWVELFNVAGYTSAGQPAEPPEQVTVWRGCTPGRRHGMSWTADRDKAQWFADRPGYASRGRVYVHRASGYELLAYISDRNESEYVIDPQYLAGGVVHPA